MSNTKQTNESGEKVVEVLSKTEQFLEKNKKRIFYGMLAVIIIAAAFFLYHRYIAVPKQKEAIAQTFVAEQNFRNDNFEVALNGDGNNLGFKQIIKEYGNNAGSAVYFYAGVCELQLGKYKEALDYLKQYSGKDKIISARAICCMGDAYAGLGENKKAVEYYEKAANYADNIFTAGYLMKAGIMYEELGNKEAALKAYNTIQDNYPQSPEGYEIGKYISRLQINK